MPIMIFSTVANFEHHPLLHDESTLGLENVPKNVQKRACMLKNVESTLGLENLPKNVQM